MLKNVCHEVFRGGEGSRPVFLNVVICNLSSKPRSKFYCQNPFFLMLCYFLPFVMGLFLAGILLLLRPSAMSLFVMGEEKQCK